MHNPNKTALAIFHPDRLAQLWAAAESPIEERLGLHLSVVLPVQVLIPQLLVETGAGTFRLDFGVDFAGHKIAIECDGHEFHERTKEQSTRDKSRDRALTAAGWRILRFTGAEIWKEPERCAAEVGSLFDSLIGRRNGAEEA